MPVAILLIALSLTFNIALDQATNRLDSGDDETLDEESIDDEQSHPLNRN